MNETLTILLLSSLWCFGFHIVFTKLVIGHILGIDFDSWWDNYLTPWQRTVSKPLFACPACMASAHGTVIFLAYFRPEVSWGYWPLFCIALCGLNFIISNLITSHEEEEDENI